MRLLVLFCVLVVYPTIASYREFLTDCIRKRGDGVCDMECRNFTADLNDFELNDCSSVETISYNVSLTVEMYPLEAIRQLQKYELLLRENLHTQVEVDFFAEERLEEIADEYRKKFANSSVKVLWLLELNYTILLQVCEDCPQGENAIEMGAKKLPAVLAVRVSPSFHNSKSYFLLISSTIVGVAFVLAIVGVLFVTTRKRRLQNQTAVFVPDMENPKRSKLSSSLPEPVLVSNVFAPPPAPAILPPPVAKGHILIKKNEIDLEANYEEVVVLKNTPLHTYVRSVKNDDFCDDLLKTLVEKNPINGQDDDGCTAFLLAVRGGNALLAKHLLYLGADGNRMDKNHMTALHHAVDNEDIKMLKMLTRWEVPLNSQTQWPEMIRVLVDAIVDDRKAVDALTNTGLTPLMKCAFVHKIMAVKLAKILIECGANVADIGDLGCSNPKLRTVLHFAALYRQNDLIKYILSTQAGISIINSMDSTEKTALCVACQEGDVESARTLLEHGALQFLPDHDKEKQPRALAKTPEKTCSQEIVDMLDEFKGKHIKGGTVRSNKRNKVKKPQRRSSGYYSGEGDHSPPPAPRSSPPRTPRSFQDPTAQYNLHNFSVISQCEMSSQMSAFEKASAYENYLYQ